MEGDRQIRSVAIVGGPTTGVDDDVAKDYIEPELSYLTHSTVDRKRIGRFLCIDSTRKRPSKDGGFFVYSVADEGRAI